MADAPVTITLEGGRALRERLQALGREAPRAITRALNRTIASARVLARRALAADLGLAQKFIDRDLATRNATFARLEAALTVRGRRLPLIAFGARGPEPSRGRGRGVSYRIGTGGRQTIASAFLATMPSGHRGVFKRRGTKRLPIAELFGPSLPHVARRRVFEAVRVKSSADLEKNLQHEIAFLMKGRADAA